MAEYTSGIKVEGNEILDLVVTKQYLIDNYPSIISIGSNIYITGNGYSLSLPAPGTKSVPTVLGFSSNDLASWSDVAVGPNYVLAVKSDGTLWAWGNNDLGQLGTNDIVFKSSPSQVGALTNWIKVFADPHSDTTTSGTSSYALKSDGTLWSWGRNDIGQLGLNDTTHRSSPVQVGSLTDWKQLFPDDFGVAAIKSDGTLWGWGGNHNGALWTNDTIHRSSPIQMGSDTTWISASRNWGATLAINQSGQLWAAGLNSLGQLGLNDIISRSSPVQVGSLTNWKKIFGGYGLSHAVKSDGTRWSWGWGGNGGIGNNSTVSHSSPVQIGSMTDWHSAVNGRSTTFFRKVDGSIWVTGYNTGGNYGNNNTTSRSSPVQLITGTNWRKIVPCGYLNFTLFLKD